MINYLSLGEFLTVSKILENGYGSFVQAADELNIDPSTLTKHLKSLESALGAPLFDRTTRRVSLNDFGHFFLPLAIELYNNYEESLNLVNSFILNQPPILKFGTVIPLIAGGPYMNAMNECVEKHPGCNIQFCEGACWSLKDMLRAKSLEFILAYKEKSDHHEFYSHTLDDDRLVAIVEHNHRFYNENCILIDMLKGENIVAGLVSSFVGNLINHACQTAGFDPQIRYSDNSNINLANIVNHGGGIGLMMESSARYFCNANMRVIPIEPAITLQLCYLYLKEHKPSPLAASFLAALQ
ncbi:MAG: LysR family transcriptional regulator [Lachnospiraceae bacterium]|nr:LysR family transcriptional regulator [Lachnospiraceae bacterium]